MPACLHAHVPLCLGCLRAHMPTCLACLCAHMPACLAWLCAHVSMYLTCSRALHTNVLYVLVCTFANVPICQACSHANMLCVPTCSHPVTSNNKSKFLITYFTQIFGTFSLIFSCEVKLCMKSAQQAGISLEAFILRIQLCIPAFLLPDGSL